MKGDEQFNHPGERSEDDIIELAKRAYGPALRLLTSRKQFDEAASLHSSSVFFLFVCAPVRPSEPPDTSTKPASETPACDPEHPAYVRSILL